MDRWVPILGYNSWAACLSLYLKIVTNYFLVLPRLGPNTFLFLYIQFILFKCRLFSSLYANIFKIFPILKNKTFPWLSSSSSHQQFLFLLSRCKLLQACICQALMCTRIIWRTCENTDHWAPFPEFLIQQVWGRIQEYAFLTSLQVMLMVGEPVWDPPL